jgi:hypothetical protein
MRTITTSSAAISLAAANSRSARTMARPAPPVDVPPSPLAPPPPPPSTLARHSVAATTTASVTVNPPAIATPQLGELAPNDPFFDQARLALVTFSHVPQIIAVAVLTPNLWVVDMGDTRCSRELAWVIVQAAFLMLSLANYWVWFWLVYWSEQRSGLSERYRTRGVSIVTKVHAVLYIFGLVWFMVGNALLLVIDADNKACTADDINHGAAGIHDLGLGMVALAYARVLWPCTLVILGLPVLLLCRPCVLRYLNDPTRDVAFAETLYAGTARGASKTTIEANSKSVKFEKGMVLSGACGDDKDPSVCCCICLVEYDVGDSLRVLPCGHDFHEACVDEWLSRNASCPTCRKAITAAGARMSVAIQEVDAIV